LSSPTRPRAGVIPVASRAVGAVSPARLACVSCPALPGMKYVHEAAVQDVTAT